MNMFFQFHRLHIHEKNEKTATCISEFKEGKAVVQNYAPTLECAIDLLTYSAQVDKIPGLLTSV